MKVKIRAERLFRQGNETWYKLTMTLTNGVTLPIDLPESRLPAVTLGRSYDCEWTKDGQFKNVCESPPPVLTPEQMDWLRTYHRKMFGKQHPIGMEFAENTEVAVGAPAVNHGDMK